MSLTGMIIFDREQTSPLPEAAGSGRGGSKLLFESLRNVSGFLLLGDC
jgi:hypothetical protein